MENDPSQEHLAASVVLAGLSAAAGAGANKHEREDDSADAAGGSFKKKRPSAPTLVAAPAQETANVEVPTESRGDLKPYPFFYYEDHSSDVDPDSLTPLTPPGRVPNFPAKMHAIMSRPDLADVICWMPHGRSWKVLKPREFEVRVIPIYFEHAKFSSFIRQANGWGFRRVTTGRDRNSYYHPLFLRSLPHLCKTMKRPGVAKKLAADPEHEPDLYKISELHPVPEKAVDDSILLQCTLQGGPKARMPIYSGILGTSSAPSMTFTNVNLEPAESKKAVAASITAPASTTLTPSDQEKLASFQASIGDFSLKTSPTTQPTTTEAATKTSGASASSVPSQMPFMISPFMVPQVPSAFAAPMAHAFPTMPTGSNHTLSALAAANQMAFGNTNPFAAFQATAAGNTNPFAAFQANAAASQFAAGFAAAAAMNQQQMQSMMQNMQSAKSDDGAATSKTS